ncbi:hypothetical protein HNV12_01765 [Methanococcoides sp. SA1]|nr:hypothetical protein [Methanococcoides sp. SA1]
MVKNAHLHIVVESEFLEKLKVEARGRMISVAELCRSKLVENVQLNRIEAKLDWVLRNGS